MKRTSLFLPQPLLTKLHALAKSTDLSVAEHVRRAIDAYLKVTKK